MYQSFGDLPLILNATILAKVLSISKSNAYTLFNSPDFPTIRVGQRKLVTRDNFLSWLEKQGASIRR